MEILSFLFQLSFSTLGRVSARFASFLDARSRMRRFWPLHFQDYSVEGMSDSLLTFLQHLREFGLVFQRKVRHSPVNFSGSNTQKSKLCLEQTARRDCESLQHLWGSNGGGV